MLVATAFANSIFLNETQPNAIALPEAKPSCFNLYDNIVYT